MKLSEFLQDSIPLGKGAVKIPIKSVIEEYHKRYDTLIKEKPKAFRHSIYRTTPGGRIIVHVKVPSETVNNFFYDVLLELEPDDKSSKIEDCHVKIFSNCPSFVYTYAYIFYHLDTNPDDNKPKKSRSGLIIDTLRYKVPRDRLLMPGTEKKIGSDVLDNAPVVRNSHGIPMFDKSLYYAVFYLQDNVPLPKILSEKNYRTERQIFDSVANFDTLMAQRKHQVEKEKAATKRDRSIQTKSIKTTEQNVRKANRLVKPISAVSPVKATSSSRSKTVRRIGGK